MAHSIFMRKSFLLVPLLLLGCGYHTAGKAARIPASVQTIAIPAFVNQTQTYRIEQRMTAAVVKEFLSRTRFKVVDSENAVSNGDADAILRATITTAQFAPLTYDSQTGRASTGLVTVTLKVTLTDKQGRALYDEPNYTFREQYQVSREISSFFEEEGPALERLSRDMAHTLVADILESY